MAQECLIVIDAWKEPTPANLINFPYLKDETKTFGSYLNHTIKSIRPNFDIFHVTSNREIMEEIDTTKDQVFPYILDIPIQYNKYYLCGFHLGRCIHKSGAAQKEQKASKSCLAKFDSRLCVNTGT